MGWRGGGVGGRVNEPDGLPLSLLGSHNLAPSWAQDLPLDQLV